MHPAAACTTLLPSASRPLLHGPPHSTSSAAALLCSSSSRRAASRPTRARLAAAAAESDQQPWSSGGEPPAAAGEGGITPEEARWQKRWDQLWSYVAENGELPKTGRLAGWVRAQREAYWAQLRGEPCPHQMTFDHETALDAIPGWSWKDPDAEI